MEWSRLRLASARQGSGFWILEPGIKISEVLAIGKMPLRWSLVETGLAFLQIWLSYGAWVQAGGIKRRRR